MTEEDARRQITEIFERIKKWHTLTKKSIKLLFRSYDKKLKNYVTKQDLQKVLIRVTTPFALTNKHLKAVMSVMGTMVPLKRDQEEVVYYENRFCYPFFQYAN